MGVKTMENKLENKINSLVENLLEDYNKGRSIDKVNTFDHPDKDVVIEILNIVDLICMKELMKTKM